MVAYVSRFTKINTFLCIDSNAIYCCCLIKFAFLRCRTRKTAIFPMRAQKLGPINLRDLEVLKEVHAVEVGQFRAPGRELRAGQGM